MKMLKKRFLNQSGMTLVETMVAASLLAGLAVAGMTLFKNQSTGQKTVEANYEITNLFQQIRVVLSAQGNCTSSLGGKNFTSDLTVDRLRKQVGAPYIDVFQTGQPISGTLVKVTSYEISKVPATGLASNESWLKINFNKGKSTLMENTTRMLKIVYTTSGANIGTCYAYNNSTDTYWMQATPPDIYFTAGNVGIGTNSPAYVLDVANPAVGPQIIARFNNADTGIATSEARVVLGQGGAFYQGISGSFNSGVPYLGFSVGTVANTWAEKMRITSSGNVGIGTTSPNILGSAGRVETIYGGNGNLELASDAADAAGTTVGRVVYAFDSNAASHKIISSVESITEGATANQRGGVLQFLTKPNASSLNIERMRIDSTGNVGIGVAAPAEKLNVAGGNIRINQDASDRYLSFGSTVKVQSSNMGGNLDFAGGSGPLPYRFWSNNFGATQMVIDSAGNVGVGTNAPAYKLHVIGDVYANGGWLRTSGDAGWYSETWGGGLYMIDATWVRTYVNKSFYSGSGTIRTDGVLDVGGGATLSVTNAGNFAYRTNVLFANTAGNVGIGTNGPAYKLDVAGDMRATNYWAVTGYWYSDARLKKDIKPFDDGLEKLLRLEPRSYTWKKDGTKDTGFIAQEVKKVLPDLVVESKDKEKSLTIKLMGLIPLIVNAIQELYEMITGTQEEVAQLKKENQELKARLDRQDAILKRIEEKANTRP